MSFFVVQIETRTAELTQIYTFSFMFVKSKQNQNIILNYYIKAKLLLFLYLGSSRGINRIFKAFIFSKEKLGVKVKDKTKFFVLSHVELFLPSFIF